LTPFNKGGGASQGGGASEVRDEMMASGKVGVEEREKCESVGPRRKKETERHHTKARGFRTGGRKAKTQKDPQNRGDMF
jgi:hypothetical protein